MKARDQREQQGGELYTPDKALSGRVNIEKKEKKRRIKVKNVIIKTRKKSVIITHLYPTNILNSFKSS